LQANALIRKSAIYNYQWNFSMLKHLSALLLLLTCYQTFAQLVPYRKGDLWGFADKNTASPVSEIKYDSAYIEQYASLIVVVKDGKKGLLQYSANTILAELLAPQYDTISITRDFIKQTSEPYNDGKHYIVTQNGKKGIFTGAGKRYVPCMYKHVEQLDDRSDYFLLESSDSFSSAVYNIETDSMLTEFAYQKLLIKEKLENNASDYAFANAKGEVFYLNVSGEWIKTPFNTKAIHATTKNYTYAMMMDENFTRKLSQVSEYYYTSNAKLDGKGIRYRNCRYTDYYINKYRIIENIKTFKLGIVDTSRDNKVIIDAVYDKIAYEIIAPNTVFALAKDSTTTILFKDSIIHTGFYDSIDINTRNFMIRTYAGKLQGCIFLPSYYYDGSLGDASNFIYSPQFHSIRCFNRDLYTRKGARVCLVSNKDNKSYFIAADGKVYYQK
jgi:hypothetical protein